MAQHKHAEVLRAIADGKEVQWSSIQGEWHDRIGGLNPMSDEDISWRIKPEPKQHVVYYGSLGGIGNLILDSCFSRYHDRTDKLKLTFDGETGALKSAEVLK